MAFKTKKPLSSQERKELLTLLGVAQSRGIEIPDISPDIFGSPVRWPIDESGYFIRIDGKHYKPDVKRANFINSRARYLIARGSRGSGKSSVGAQKALKKIMEGQDGAVMNPSFENFKISTWPEFRAWIPWDMVIPSQRNRQLPQWQPTQPFVMVFTNGVRVYCKGLKDPDSARGPNINWLWYDEPGMDRDGVAWQLANASVRVGVDPQSWGTTTPKGKGHWTYKFFESQEFITKEARDAFTAAGGDRSLIESYHLLLSENKENLDPAFYASLLAAYPSGYLKAQEIDGEYADEGGQIGDRNWFKATKISSIPDEWTIQSRVRYWDLAATEKKVDNDPDETVGSLVGKFNRVGSQNLNFILEDQVAGYFAWEKLKDVIVNTALRDGPYVKVVLEQEPASGGKNQVAELISLFKNNPVHPELAAWTVEGQRPTDRVIEANTWFGYAAKGDMWILDGLWVEKFFDQLDGFLITLHDDRVTSVSGAVRNLNPWKSWSKPSFITI